MYLYWIHGYPEKVSTCILGIHFKTIDIINDYIDKKLLISILTQNFDKETPQITINLRRLLRKR